MFTTAKDMENDFRRNLSAMDADEVFANREAVTARLRAMGMYGLARDLSEIRENRDNTEAFARLYAAFDAMPYGGVHIEGLHPENIEFECLYGLTDPASNARGREITFTVRDVNGRIPVYLRPENILVSFSLNAREGDMVCRVKSCDRSEKDMSTKVTLDVRISDEAFGSEGEFVMRISVKLGGTVAASRSVRFTVKNTFPNFFEEEQAGTLGFLTPLPQSPLSLSRLKPGQKPEKEVLVSKSVIQSRQKNTRITFDKRRGEGIPTVLCGNGAFRPGVPTETFVNISFRPTSHKTLERKLMAAGLSTNLPPETAVWVEWENIVLVYNIQHKGFVT